MNIRRIIKKPFNPFGFIIRHYFSWIKNDRLYLRLLFFFEMKGKILHLDNPKTFSEKIQWLKLYNRNPDYSKMVDKYAVKAHVSETLGKEFVVPTLGLWDRVEDIDWESLPDQFVLKTTHGGGNTGVVICRDKTSFDKDRAIKKLKDSLNHDIYRELREWPYKNVPKRIIAEQYIDPSPNVKDLPDYKWYCFGGEPKYCQVIQNRSTNETIDFFDTEWRHQDFIGLMPVVGPESSSADTKPSRPKHLETHLSIARELSKNIPFSRIDLYETEENTYFGEITFYPMTGMGVFKPDQYNEMLGQMIELPGLSGGGSYQAVT